MNHDEAKAIVEKVLHDAGIHVEIHGCGCCGSPVLEGTIHGQQVEHDNFNIDSRPEDQKPVYPIQ